MSTEWGDFRTFILPFLLLLEFPRSSWVWYMIENIFQLYSVRETNGKETRDYYRFFIGPERNKQ